MKSRVSPKPGFHPGVLVGAVIVHDQMQIELGYLGIDLLEETDEFLMPMPRHAVANHFAVEHAQGRKQRGRAVAFVVVCPGCAVALPQRKTWLGTIESLNLTFLVDTRNEGFLRRIEIQPNDVVELLDEVLVAADLEGLGEMGLEAVLFPDALNGHATDTLCFGHAPHAPMGGIGRFAVQGGFDDCADFLVGNVRNAAGTRSVLFQTLQPQSHKALSPELHRGPGDTQLLCDILTEYAVSCLLNNLCTLHQSHRQSSSMSPCAHSRPFLARQNNRARCSHAA